MPDLPRLPAGAQARDGGAVGRRRRREFRRLSPLSLHMMEERMRSRAAARPAPAAVRPARAASIRRPTGRRACCAPRRPSKRWRATRVRGLLPQRVDPARRSAHAAVLSWRSARSSAATARSKCSSATPRRAGTDDPLALIQYLDLQDLPGRRHQHQGRPREHGALARGARAADGSSSCVEWLATLPSALKLRGGEGK